MDFELINANYTHKNTRGGMSRIDRFLASPMWIEQFGEHQEKVEILRSQATEYCCYRQRNQKEDPNLFALSDTGWINLNY